MAPIAGGVCSTRCPRALGFLWLSTTERVPLARGPDGPEPRRSGGCALRARRGWAWIEEKEEELADRNRVPGQASRQRFEDLGEKAVLARTEHRGGIRAPPGFPPGYKCVEPRRRPGLIAAAGEETRGGCGVGAMGTPGKNDIGFEGQKELETRYKGRERSGFTSAVAAATVAREKHGD